MKKLINILVLLVFAAAAFGFPQTASAKPAALPSFEDKVVFSGTYTLQSGETLSGSLVAVGAVVTLEEGSVVSGDVILIGGNLTAYGEVNRSLVALGGVVLLKNSAVINGDLIAPGANLIRDEGSQIRGQVITESNQISVDIPVVPEIPEVPQAPAAPPSFERSAPTFVEALGISFAPITTMLWFMFRLFAFSTVAILLMLFVPNQTERVRDASIENPILAGSLGLLGIVLSFPVMVLLAITIILSPAAFLVAVVICLGIFYGWVAIGTEIGRRIGEALSQSWSLAIQAGVGVFSLSFVVGAFDLFVWGGIGWMLGIALGCIGFGSVILTRFGTQEYSPSTAPGLPAKPAPSE